MVDPPPGQAQPGQPIDDDLRCTRCGYNLRGLTLDKLCPECATPIARSVHGNLLRYADPGWVDKLRMGAALSLWNLLIGLVMGLGAGVLASVGVPQTLAGLPTLVAGVLGMWATFLLTAPEPAVAFEEDPVTLRKLVRVCVVAGFVGSILQQVVQSAGTGVPIFVLGGVLSLVGLAAMFGLFVYLRRFASRIPDERLARQTTIVMWGYAGATGVAAMLALLVVTLLGVLPGMAGLTPGGAPPAGAALAGITALGCIAGLGLAVFGIWYIALLFRYHSAFRLATAEARQTLADSQRDWQPSRPPDAPTPPA